MTTTTSDTTMAGSFAPAGEEREPVAWLALSVFLALLVISPLMRGGNRHVALIVIEAAALAFLVLLLPALSRTRLKSPRDWVLGFVLLSPLWLAFVYLLPVPAGLWDALPGRAQYTELLAAAGISRPQFLASSLVPDATLVSLLAGIPLVAAFAAGYLTSPRQLRTVLGVLVVIALAQVMFGLLQAGGGKGSTLYFGGTGSRPFGTFANPNHFANYLAMALVAYVVIAWYRLAGPQSWRDPPRGGSRGRAMIVWSAGAVFLLVGILMSRSRGGTMAALFSGTLAFLVAMSLGARGRRQSWRTTAVMAAVAVAAGISLVGADVLLSRFDLNELEGALPFRTVQAATTLEGARHFWPWGAGWGTYYSVYPRFQPGELVGIADYAHHDYAQMLFEGGLFAVLLMAAFAWLAITRTVVLVRRAMHMHKLGRAEMMAALCGIGLLGFLLHSLIEFNMHIPANAIVASLLAGAFLRPLPAEPHGSHPEAPA